MRGIKEERLKWKNVFIEYKSFDFDVTINKSRDNKTYRGRASTKVWKKKKIRKTRLWSLEALVVYF